MVVATSVIVIASIVLTIAAEPLWGMAERAAENLQTPLDYVSNVLGDEG
jgi:multicomponent Na+:H+ antiporter subunit D